jgi:hypothetical protein
MWIDAAHKFYVVDNKEAKIGPFVLMEVWKTCRDVTKWKTYNEELRNARKRTSFHLEGDNEENNQTVDDMPKRPMGQKAAKKAALAEKKQSKRDDGNSKEFVIDVDKIDRFSKFQEETNANRIKVLELQQKLSSEKLEATKLAHLTAQESKEGKKLLLEAKKVERESKMMDAYNNLISQDTSTMSDEEMAERVAAMKCLRKTLFHETF